MASTKITKLTAKQYRQWLEKSKPTNLGQTLQYQGKNKQVSFYNTNDPEGQRGKKANFEASKLYEPKIDTETYGGKGRYNRNLVNLISRVTSTQNSKKPVYYRALSNLQKSSHKQLYKDLLENKKKTKKDVVEAISKVFDSTRVKHAEHRFQNIKDMRDVLFQSHPVYQKNAISIVNATMNEKYDPKELHRSLTENLKIENDFKQGKIKGLPKTNNPHMILNKWKIQDSPDLSRQQEEVMKRVSH